MKNQITGNSRKIFPFPLKKLHRRDFISKIFNGIKKSERIFRQARISIFTILQHSGVYKNKPTSFLCAAPWPSIFRHPCRSHDSDKGKDLRPDCKPKPHKACWLRPVSQNLLIFQTRKSGQYPEKRKCLVLTSRIHISFPSINRND